MSKKRIKLNNFDIPDLGKEIYSLAKDLFPINRSLTGNGVRASLKIIKKHLPKLKIKEIKSGTKVFDWVVPEEWNVTDAYIELDGKKIIDFKNNNLHLVSYSTPINKEMLFEDLKKHLYVNKSIPEAIPYTVSFYKKNWGFCLTYNQYKKISLIKNKKFRVVINSSFKKKGSMTYAEFILKGASSKEILLTSYTCHPSLGNNEVSGPTLLTFLAKFLSSLKYRRYTYRFVFHPETIGAISYLSKNLNVLKKNVIGGYVLTCVGDNDSYSYMPTRNGNTLSDSAALNILKNKKNFTKYSFLDSGSDERRYCAPGVDLPIGSVMRTKYGSYKEYHTSLDDLNFISAKGFQGSFKAYLEIIKGFENNFYFKINTICEPQLGKRGLYPQVSKWPNNDIWKELKKLVNFTSYADGNLNLIDLSNKIDTSIGDLINIVDKLNHEGLVIINN
tara:strand:- start:1506 stop:2840 length:1335 start_codon:yes stop_codon:yes gene_type:complete